MHGLHWIMPHRSRVMITKKAETEFGIAAR